MTTEITCAMWHVPIHIYFVYASYSPHTKKELWEDRVSIRSNLTHPWMVVGDFNIIISQSEKLGGKPVNLQVITDFTNMIQRAGFIDEEINLLGVVKELVLQLFLKDWIKLSIIHIRVIHF